MAAIDIWGLGDGADALGAVFGDVFGRAGVDEVDLEVWWTGMRCCACGSRCEIPVVDVIGAEIGDGAETLCKVLEVSYIGAECSTLYLISSDA